MGIIEINHQSHLTEKIIALLDLHYATSGSKNKCLGHPHYKKPPFAPFRK